MEESCLLQQLRKGWGCSKRGRRDAFTMFPFAAVFLWKKQIRSPACALPNPACLFYLYIKHIPDKQLSSIFEISMEEIKAVILYTLMGEEAPLTSAAHTSEETCEGSDCASRKMLSTALSLGSYWSECVHNLQAEDIIKPLTILQQERNSKWPFGHWFSWWLHLHFKTRGEKERSPELGNGTKSMWCCETLPVMHYKFHKYHMKGADVVRIHSAIWIHHATLVELVNKIAPDIQMWLSF